MKRFIIKKLEIFFAYLGALCVILGSCLTVALLFLAPAIQEHMYYLLLTCGLGGVSFGALIYLFIFGELKLGADK